MSDPFAYNNGAGIVPDGAFRISPSQLSKFFDDTSNWYRQHLMGEAGFQGNTATELGACVHAAAEMYTNHGAIDHAAITQYIYNCTTPDIDRQPILEQYPVMAQELVSQYLSSRSHHTVETELFVWNEVIPGIGIGGSIDRYDEARATISDYKTMGSLDKARVPKSFPRQYYFQQLAYAWLLRKQGKPVDYLELVYISRSNVGRFNDKGKPLKDYPSEVNIVKHPITDADMSIIESVIHLMCDSVKLWREEPHLHYLLAQDYRLRLPAKPTLFKD